MNILNTNFFQIIERHITTDKNLKGSDHKCSLEPNEFATLTKNIRTLEKALGNPHKIIQKSELICYEKLGKTLIFSKNLPKGHQLNLSDLHVKVTIPKGIDGSQIDQILGKHLVKDVKENDSVNLKNVV